MPRSSSSSTPTPPRSDRRAVATAVGHRRPLSPRCPWHGHRGGPRRVACWSCGAADRRPPAVEAVERGPSLLLADPRSAESELSERLVFDARAVRPAHLAARHRRRRPAVGMAGAGSVGYFFAEPGATFDPEDGTDRWFGFTRSPEQRPRHTDGARPAADRRRAGRGERRDQRRPGVGWRGARSTGGPSTPPARR